MPRQSGMFHTQGDDPFDVSDDRAVTLAVDRVRTGQGCVDVVVNTAGIPEGGSISSDASVESWPACPRDERDRCNAHGVRV